MASSGEDPQDISPDEQGDAGTQAASGDDEQQGGQRRGGHSAKPRPQFDPDFKPTSKDTIVERATSEYLALTEGAEISLRQTRDGLLRHINNAIAAEAAARHAKMARAPQLTTLDTLDELTTVRVLLSRERIVSITLSDDVHSDATVLGIYQHEGENEGLYLVADTPLAQLATQLKPSLTGRQIDSVLSLLRAHAPVVGRTRDARLSPVANGVYDNEAQELLPFSPDMVFLTKSPYPYDSTAENPVYDDYGHGPWDFDSWLAELSDDEGVPELLWEIISATLRPNVRWDKAAFLHSSRGNNGKGTFCQVLRQAVGPAGHASIPIARFSKPFALTALTHATAIITDENGVGAFAQDLSDFKSVVTGDAFMLDRKHKDPITARFSGMVVQCVNDFPKSRDKSASYTRRQLFVPFRKWFGGDERKYIKSDYLRRPETMRYVVRRALEMTHTELSEPEACRELLAQFQRENNPVRDFWQEHEDEFVWDLLPTAFLFDMFVAWFRASHPSGTPLNRNEFSNQLEDMLADDPGWDYSDPRKKHRIGKHMAVPEPLIAKYDLDNWRNSTYSGKDPKRIGVFDRPTPNYRGVRRGQLPQAPAPVPLSSIAHLPLAVGAEEAGGAVSSDTNTDAQSETTESEAGA